MSSTFSDQVRLVCKDWANTGRWDTLIEKRSIEINLDKLLKEIAIFPKQVCHAENETKSQNDSIFKYWKWRITVSEVLEKVSDDEIVRKPEKMW